MRVPHRRSEQATRAARPRDAHGHVRGVHGIYDFAVFCLPWSAPVSASVATIADLAIADLAPGTLHPDLALLPATPMHH